MDLNGHSALITGGASGLGAATARALAAAGARVGIIDLNADAATALATELGGAAAVFDVADPDAASAGLEALSAKLGPVRVLVNCAGIGPAARIVGKTGPMDLALFEKVIRVNLVGSFNMMRLAAARMQGLDPLAQGERGVIIATASIAAFEGQIGQAAYAASKGGIVGLTLPAAREFAAFGVRVMTIAPGLFRTPLMETLPVATQDSLGAAIPFPARLGLPDEFAALALSIIGNPFLNGETIRLDGALRMAPR